MRNVNDAPVFSGPENVTFVEEKTAPIFGGITFDDPDRDLGYYRVTFKRAPHRVAASTTKGCSLRNVGLQTPPRRVAALGLVLQAGRHGVAASSA